MTYVRKIGDVYPANGLTITEGTQTAGNLASTATLADGDFLQITETVTTPGLDVRFDFVSVNRIREVIFSGYYEGSTSHNVTIDLYNYDDVAWDTLHTFYTGLYTSHVYIRIPVDADYVSGGLAVMRFYHAIIGNINHDLYIDYVGLGY
jgi:hypothetical protein